MPLPPHCVCSVLAACAPKRSRRRTPHPPRNRPRSRRRMQVTPLKSGWLVAPDVKFTQVDDHAATFAGGYGGWVTEGVFLVGAGGYWLANGSDDREMAYGGLVLEWLARTDKRVGFGARTLVGGGTATVGLSYTDLYGTDGASRARRRAGAVRPPRRPRPGHGFDPGNLTDRTFRVSENFFVAEPQANVLLTITDWMRINAGVGYRLIGGTSLLDDRSTASAGPSPSSSAAAH